MTSSLRPDGLHKIAEGREAEIFAWEDGTVLRLLRNPDRQQQVEWEAAAMRAAASAGVRVPAVHDTTTVDERPGLIMERIDGRDMLTLVGRQPWQVWPVGRTSGRLHAELHEVLAPDALPSLKERFRQRLGGSGLVPPHLAGPALARLDEMPDGDRVCHGDFHPGNVIRTEGEPVIIDWTNVARGDPDADFTRTMLMLRLGDVPPGAPLVIRYGARFARRLMIGAYLGAYRRHRSVDMAAAARWEVPVAANRLVDGIESERPKLLRLLEDRVGAA